jgi:hypothetical protein
MRETIIEGGYLIICECAKLNQTNVLLIQERRVL